jgi:UDP-N-acetylmuramate--alanine ligase
VLTGNPVRADILAVATDRERLAKEARVELELEEGKRTIVVFGGSQGALHLNRAFADALRVFDRSDLQVVLMTGPAHVEAVRASLPVGGTVTVRVQGFLERMELAYAVADAVVARAGATTIAEIGVSGLPSLLVPYPYATGRHQEANARALQRAGAATMLLDDELDGRVPRGPDRVAALRRPAPAVDGRARPGVVEAGRGERARADGARGGGWGMSGYRPPHGSIPTLEVPDLADVRRVHMIGIGGAGMRNLARLFLARGVGVTGSDLKDSEGVQELRALGAAIATGHAGANLGDADAVVVSSAIRDDNPELVEARRRGIPTWARAQALAAAATDRREIAVAGTHGKTTTTAMIALVLQRAGLDPTYVIGGEMNESGSGANAGSGELFVSEADESDGSFLLGRPAVGVVTNIELDHVDFYVGGLEEIESAFTAFAARCDHVVVCADDPSAMRAVESAGRPVTTYGRRPDAGIRVDVDSVGPGGASARLDAGGRSHDLRLAVDGAHNLLNAAAAVAAAEAVGVSAAAAVEALAGFAGVHRRFERRGSVRGADFYDDYGHVPTELEVTLDVARRTDHRRVLAVFQPHRYSRTQALWKELGASLVGADVIVVTDIYGAAQEPIPGVTGKLVVEGIARTGRDRRVVYLPHRNDVVEFLTREVRRGDLVLTMGCGDVWMLGDAALERIEEAS